ncbi:hypothetical protein LCGC14_1436410 [marine sediment metagenome]|uniref:Transposase IS4-like domain-containing protein n=1 Tax=marine sediment metagenome TaxID=412755 RepID=A0A0F9M2K6_9ZZZZ
MKEPNPTIESIGFNNIKGFPKEKRKTKIRNYFRTLRKEIYPHIKFKMRHNAKYSSDDILDLLTHTALNHDFTNNGSKTFGFTRENSPDGDTVLYHMKKHSAADYIRMFNKVNYRILWMAQNRGLLKGKLDVAIDFTDQLYYGKKDTPMIVGTKPQRGAHYAYKYATINIVEKGIRFTLLAIPKSQLVTMMHIVKTLIEYAKTKIDIGTVYLDRGFYSKDVMRYLDENDIKFLMPAPMNKRIVRVTEGVAAQTVIPLKIGIIQGRRGKERFKDPVEINLVVTEDSYGKRYFATNLNVIDGYGNYLLKKYKKRWGIETSYRMKNIFRTRTTSKNYAIRLFMFLFSVCLYNLWVLINAFVEAFIFKKALKKPYLTAKVFGAILISTGFYIDNGG